jgi:hypothetical protein
MLSRKKRSRYVYGLEVGVDGNGFKLVNAQPISPAFASGMELPAYWICWMRRERNGRTKMRMRKATPTAPSLPFYSTNRLLVDGLNGLLSLQKAGPLEVR